MRSVTINLSFEKDHKEMKPIFDPIQYKITVKANWNTVAPEYHYNWADKKIGPFKSTMEIIKLASIKPDDKILDVACGTGVVSKEISQVLGPKGLLVGIDLSRTALGIARGSISYQNSIFIEMDAENMGFNFKFDKVTCQYGLMFFPDSRKVLESIRKILKHDGMLVVAVHGLAEDVPYFSTIMKPVLEHIPDIRPYGTPTVHRFGNPKDLELELSGAGFEDVIITRHDFVYEPGTFEEYWIDYMNSTANSIKSKMESYGQEVMDKIKCDAKKNALRYERNGNLMFPWTVLIASGINH
ncbi:MAG: methyltransferase domain-containing protein [Thaumarchaeota archaeon]|nr:methyltransferase domain-containing protein [Nitrososphaerota archaeon]MDE1832154.1 methyltransferase domain-containing protein [Nitrososphaerota archaeon]MDE1840292.1 methyltransferase domain-containing protein [Nitrososphaerota archaeon]MDE1876893.1 methyltransferase domain-containing protein [Nitrososphaerota archaeon]